MEQDTVFLNGLKVSGLRLLPGYCPYFVKLRRNHIGIVKNRE